MKMFKLSIHDDQLLNSNELTTFLENNLDQTVLISSDNEGPSLFHSNVIKLIDNHVRIHKRDPYTIRLDSMNLEEKTNLYTNINKWKTLNHWWQESVKKYKTLSIDSINVGHHKLGCFIGRKNIPRLSILYWLQKQDCLLSSMNDEKYNYDILDKTMFDSWVDDPEEFSDWASSFNIPSLDSRTVLDQYKKDQYLGPQFSLLNYYNNFDIEIVAETWTMGTTFFATEKTTRPLLGRKPMIVYGPKDYLHNLRQLGFKTWSSCWDETYDHYTGPQRWKAMQETINNILSLTSDEYQAVIKQAHTISLYNKQFYLETLVNKNPT